MALAEFSKELSETFLLSLGAFFAGDDFNARIYVFCLSI